MGLLRREMPMSNPSERNDDQAHGEEAVPTANLGAGSVGPGGKIGRYKLLSILGEGGYGIVYLAEQQRPVKRRVALKLIKPGMDTKQVIARFEAERQALALLDHPNIAHVFDAGTTHAGRPYFVMEYVKGIPITEHCDREKLAIEERLRLFLRVCEAVQHAHQKGIIHRDIKPFNIQVSIHSEQVVPKVIDFGVAKAITQPLTERTLVTEVGQFVGTPEYMSPEQAEMTGQDIDTRSDVYSLGAVLYELLTGVLPFDPRTLREGGVEHIRHMIREEDPKTPSTRLSTISEEESTKVAQLRRTDIRTLGRRLHGDLDWITIKAMEKDRMHRYQTAHALAEDIRRHLSHEPVLAGPPSIIYRLRKFLRKHQSQAIAAAAIAILITGMAIASVMYIRAADRSREAESLEHANILSQAMQYRSKGQFQEALAKVETILDSEHIGPEARLLRARIVLELQGPAETIGQLEELTNERDEIAWQAHFLLARIYLETDPGNPSAVQEYQQKGREHQQKGEGVFSETAEAYFNRAVIAGTVDKSIEYLDKALRIDSGHYPSRRARTMGYYALRDYRNMERNAIAMTALRDWDPKGYSLLAIALRQTGDFTDALEHHNRAIEILGDDPGLYDERRQTYMQMGNHEQALWDAQECVRLQPNNQKYRFHVFCALVLLGDFEQAQAEYDEFFDPNGRSRQQFTNWARKHVFDTLGAGQSWHPPEAKPMGVAFLSMIEADEDWRGLAKKAKRIVPEGFSPTWSPDGAELVYSRGPTGSSGIEIVNVETGKTRLLTVPGWDPAWSPDGDYIAFVRGRQTLLLADLTTEHVARIPSHKHREIWLIKADGTEEPRFLTKGHWPCWSRDSKRIFYQLPEAMKIYSISIKEGSESRPIAWCPSTNYPAVSPDRKHVAYTSARSGIVHVMDTYSRSLAASWAGLQGMLFINWSSDSRHLSVAGGWGFAVGLWIYDIEAKEASQVLSGRITWGRWSPDGSRMVLALGPPSQEIWVANTESLGSGRRLEEHYEEVINRLTRRIETDPENASNYRSRAVSYIHLGDRQKVFDDLRKYEDIVKDPSVAAQAYDDTAWRLVRRNQKTVHPEIAVDLSRKAHEMEPKNGGYLSSLGAAYYRAGQWKEAITTLTKSIEQFSDERHGGNYFFLAMAHWQLDNRAAATDWYSKAIEWIENNSFIWTSVQGQAIYDIYIESSSLMGIETREL
jgi:serine/threonine protein kinase/Flp pilus assembly protein TadD